MKTEEATDLVATIRCIVCPTGCEINVKKNASSGEITFEGYTCKRGLEYARQEFYEPKRIITTTIRVENGFLSLIPVRTNLPIAKAKLKTVLEVNMVIKM